MELQKKRILIVEDEFLVAFANSIVLRRAGFDVITAGSGEEALEIIQKAPIDLILMDIDLGPGINGLQTTEIILKKFKVPVIFMSSHEDQETVSRAKHISKYGYIVKHNAHFQLLPSIEKAFSLYKSNKNKQTN